jgi:ribonuclease HI
VALRLERRGPTDQTHPQESNRAQIRAAIVALQCRQWRDEGWSSVVIASDSEYLVEGITNWVEIWQENGWRTSRDTGDSREGDPVANQDLWETLLQELLELLARGLEVKFWLIVHGLNKEAQAEARLAAQTLKDEESFCRYPYVYGVSTWICHGFAMSAAQVTGGLFSAGSTGPKQSAGSTKAHFKSNARTYRDYLVLTLMDWVTF